MPDTEQGWTCEEQGNTGHRAGAAPAAAAPTIKIEIPSGEVHFTAGDGQANFVTVTKLSGLLHVYRFDDVHPIRIG